jgi:hypothetical protein
MTLRVHTSGNSEAQGYLMVEVSPEDHSGSGSRYISVHRLVAISHGVLDDLGDPREVHHRDGCPCHNAVANLEALDLEEHGRVTRQQAAERRMA